MARPQLTHDMRSISISIPVALFDKLRAFADAENLSVNAVVARMIRMGVMVMDDSEEGTDIVFRERATGKERTAFFF